ncbi:MAG: FAD-dependent oxidoreductase [Caulobacteraceae bacterium]|nr:FAD-dependent oxidoreductase [Caulobacter sp.]
MIPPAPEPASPDAHVLIVGAGHAGGAVAIALRQAGFGGPITLVGEEPAAPYQRPPLSKAWLKGEADGDSLLLKPLDWYARNGVDLRLQTRVERLDLAAGRAAVGGGRAIGFDRLVLATGARARRLQIPGADLYGVLALRDMADAEALKATLAPGRTLAVIGGGYVGLECAASARALGAEAVVLERAPRLLARVACEELSAFYTAQHLAHGVRIELGADIIGLEAADGRVAGVRLADGRVIACEAALLGVGAQPNVELAQAAGLACDDGVIVDEHAHTSDPRVFAVGDVSRRPLPQYGQLHRLESVPSALEQARQVAAVLTGGTPPTIEAPWFWSDQYDLKLQIAGLPLDCDARVVRGDPQAARFSIFHLHGGAVRAVETVNAPADFMAARKLIASGVPVDPAALGDPATPLKALLAA